MVFPAARMGVLILSQVPVQNRQYSDQLQAGLLGQGMGFKIPFGQTTTSNSMQSVLDQMNQMYNNQSNTQSQQNQTQKIGGKGLFGALGL